MGCCGKDGGCKRNSEAEAFTFPTPDVIGMGAEVLTKLQEIASAGLRAGRIFSSLDVKNTSLAQLAKQISDLAVENAYLKSVLNLFSPMDIGVTDSVFELRFGPRNSFNLKIPVTENNSRRDIARQLRDAAAKLEKEITADKEKYLPDQKLLPFDAPAAS